MEDIVLAHGQKVKIKSGGRVVVEVRSHTADSAWSDSVFTNGVNAAVDYRNSEITITVFDHGGVSIHVARQDGIDLTEMTHRREDGIVADGSSVGDHQDSDRGGGDPRTLDDKPNGSLCAKSNKRSSGEGTSSRGTKKSRTEGIVGTIRGISEGDFQIPSVEPVAYVKETQADVTGVASRTSYSGTIIVSETQEVDPSQRHMGVTENQDAGATLNQDQDWNSGNTSSDYEFLIPSEKEPESAKISRKENSPATRRSTRKHSILAAAKLKEMAVMLSRTHSGGTDQSSSSGDKTENEMDQEFEEPYTQNSDYTPDDDDAYEYDDDDDDDDGSGSGGQRNLPRRRPGNDEDEDDSDEDNDEDDDDDDGFLKDLPSDDEDNSDSEAELLPLSQKSSGSTGTQRTTSTIFSEDALIDLGYAPPMPEQEQVDFNDIPDHETNPFVQQGGHDVNPTNEKSRFRYKIGIQAIRTIITLLRTPRYTLDSPWKGKVRPRHHVEALQFKGKITLPMFPKYKFQVSLNGKCVTGTSSSHFHKMCMYCCTFSSQVRMFGDKAVCNGCGEVEIYTVVEKRIVSNDVTHIALSLITIKADSIEARDEIKSKVRGLWNNNIGVMAKKYKVKDFDWKKPTVSPFLSKEDAITEHNARSTAYWLKSLVSTNIVFLSDKMTISKDRTALKRKFEQIGLQLKCQKPKSLKKLPENFIIPTGEQKFTQEGNYVYTKYLMDGVYDGIKTNQKGEKTNSDYGSCAIYEQSTNHQLEWKKSYQLSSGIDPYRAECIHQLTTLFGYLLKRKVPVEGVQYSISFINFVICFGKWEPGDMLLVRELFNFRFGVDLICT